MSYIDNYIRGLNDNFGSISVGLENSVYKESKQKKEKKSKVKQDKISAYDLTNKWFDDQTDLYKDSRETVEEKKARKKAEKERKKEKKRKKREKYDKKYYKKHGEYPTDKKYKKHLKKQKEKKLAAQEFAVEHEDPRVEKVLQNLEMFIDADQSFIIPIGKSEKVVNRNVKKIQKRINKYRKGKVELFDPEFYYLLEEKGISVEDMQYAEE